MERSLADPETKMGLKWLTNDALVEKTGVNTFIVLFSCVKIVCHSPLLCFKDTAGIIERN